MARPKGSKNRPRVPDGLFNDDDFRNLPPEKVIEQIEKMGTITGSNDDPRENAKENKDKLWHANGKKLKRVYQRKWNRAIYVLRESPTHWFIIMENDLETHLATGKLKEGDLLVYTRYTKAVKTGLIIANL
jgi:hypothetical protein